VLGGSDSRRGLSGKARRESCRVVDRCGLIWVSRPTGEGSPGQGNGQAPRKGSAEGDRRVYSEDRQDSAGQGNRGHECLIRGRFSPLCVTMWMTLHRGVRTDWRTDRTLSAACPLLAPDVRRARAESGQVNGNRKSVWGEVSGVGSED
jgi:hypothetical protein